MITRFATLVNFDEISRHFDASYLFDGKMPIFLKNVGKNVTSLSAMPLVCFSNPPPQSLKKFLTGEEKNILHFVSQKHFVKQVPTTIKDSRLDFFPGFFFFNKIGIGP